jgi:hypothetical protein
LNVFSNSIDLRAGQVTQIIITDLFQDSESFLVELEDEDSVLVQGGLTQDALNYGFSEFLNFGVKALQYALYGFAIYNIMLLATKFSDTATTHAGGDSSSAGSNNSIGVFSGKAFSNPFF